MGRQIKEGLDYFPIECEFFWSDPDAKRIKARFGVKGHYILFFIWSLIYKDKGYYTEWDEDSAYLIADDIGDGVNPQLVLQVVDYCVKRSLFDDKLFNVVKVLTGRGIQKRYIRAKSTCEEIVIDYRYWLLDEANNKDVPKGILNKITFINKDLQINRINLQINQEDLQIKTQSKVKKNKVKKSKESKEKEAKISYADFVTLTQTEYDKLINIFGENKTKLYIEKLSDYKGSSGKKYNSDYYTIRKWINDAKNEKQQKETNMSEQRQKEYDDMMSADEEWLLNQI